MTKSKRLFLAFILSLFLILLWGNPAHAEATPTACTNNFLGCVTTQFFSKFPFDIFASLSPSEVTCPEIVFFQRSFEFCFLYDAVRILKYPLVASVLIKMYIFS
jgi:hypothetical protein